MKRRAWAILGLVVLALLAGWLLRGTGFLPGRADIASTAAEHTGAKAYAARESPPHAGPGATGGEYFTLDAVLRASQLESPEARRLLSEGDRLDMLLMAGMLCDAAEVHRKWGKVKDMPAASRRSWEFRMAFAREFCDPAMPHYTEYGARLAELDVSDDTAIALGLGALEGAEVESVGVPTAAKLLRESASVSALKRASDFLLLSGRDLPQAGRVPLPASLRDPQSRMDAQRLAVDMVACGIRGGCGPRGLQTMAWCDRCGPSVTLEQVWQRRYPPEMVAYARALAAQIAADRRRAGAP
jgi:hypothetical protein